MNTVPPVEHGPAEREHYDLIVIGSGPAGHHGAIEAAKFGKTVAIVDRRQSLGGACLHTGTIPSKTLREAILYWSGFRQRAFYGKDYRLKPRLQLEDLMFRVQEVVKRHYSVVADQLQRSGTVIIDGWARFSDAHTVRIDGPVPKEISSDYLLIACGTRPARRDDIPFDSPRVHDSDEFIQVTSGELPRSIIVAGGGVIGLEYASMMATLGTAVTVVDVRSTLLEHVDAEITGTLCYQMRRNGVSFRLGERVTAVSAEDGRPVVAHLESGRSLIAEALLYAVGRQPNSDRLSAERAGLGLDERGRVAVNCAFQTAVPHIYAAGDVIGPPSLASTSMEQGRLAVRHMFGVKPSGRADLLPYAIYTIPEISMVGKTEQQLSAERVPWEAGVAAFDEVAKAQIGGDQTGLLKLLFDTRDFSLLGVHIIGDGASELIHIGQTAMMANATIQTLGEVVFNYPSLAEAYRLAAANGVDKLRHGTGLQVK